MFPVGHGPVIRHWYYPGRLAARLLAEDRTSNRAILVTSYRPGNYFHQMFIFIIGQNMQQMNLSCIGKNVVFSINLSFG
jgi:hypothetical protein